MVASRSSTAARKKKPAGGKVRNPATGRMVKRTGAIGRRLLAGEPRYVVTAGAAKKSNRRLVVSQFRESAQTQSEAVKAVYRALEKRGLVVAYMSVEKKEAGEKVAPAPSLWTDAAAPGDKYSAIEANGDGFFQGFGKTRDEAYRNLCANAPSDANISSMKHVLYHKRQ